MTAIEEAKKLIDEVRRLLGDGDHLEGWTLADLAGDFDRQLTDEERSQPIEEIIEELARLCPDELTTSP